MTTLLALCGLGALLELDTTYAFQLTFSRGIIAGPLLGLLIGDPLTGLQVGIFTELLFLDMSPLGCILPPSATVCCTITLALFTLKIPLYFAFFFGVVGAILFSGLEIFLRKRRCGWIAQQEQKIIHNPAHLSYCIVTALFMSLILNFVFILFFSGIVGIPLAKFIPLLPEKLHLAGKFSFMAVPWIGLVTLLSTFRLKAR